jgi:hypothetical protein
VDGVGDGVVVGVGVRLAAVELAWLLPDREPELERARPVLAGAAPERRAAGAAFAGRRPAPGDEPLP